MYRLPLLHLVYCGLEYCLEQRYIYIYIYTYIRPGGLAMLVDVKCGHTGNKRNNYKLEIVTCPEQILNYWPNERKFIK